MFELIVELLNIPYPVSKTVDSSPAATYYRRMIWGARFLALLGLVGSLGMWIAVGIEASQEPNEPQFRTGKQVLSFLLAPVLFSASGYLGGLILALPFAPASFFQGAFGEQVLAFVGVRSIGSARFVCLLLAAICWGIPLLLAGVIVRKAYDNEWTQPGGWLYRTPEQPSVAAAPAVLVEPTPPDPVNLAKSFADSVRFEVKQDEFREITISKESALQLIYNRLEEQRTLSSESPEALAELDKLESELDTDPWLKVAKSILDNTESIHKLIEQSPKLNSLEMAATAEAESTSPPMSIKDVQPKSVIAISETRGTLKLSAKWNALLGEFRADSFESVQNVIVIRSASQVLGIYQSDNAFAKGMTRVLEKAIADNPDGDLKDPGMQQWLYKLGSYRWMYHIALVDRKESVPIQSRVVYVDDSPQQTIRSNGMMPGNAHHEIDNARNKARQYLSDLFR